MTLLDCDGRGMVVLQKRVHLGIIPFEFELLAKLLSNGCFDSLEDVRENTKVGRVVLVVLATLEDTCTDETCVPSIEVL